MNNADDNLEKALESSASAFSFSVLIELFCVATFVFEFSASATFETILFYVKFAYSTI